MIIYYYGSVVLIIKFSILLFSKIQSDILESRDRLLSECSKLIIVN